MDTITQQACQALFDGNRTEVEKIIRPRMSTREMESLDLWLLASSTEEDESRLELLEYVRKSRQLPYSAFASEILQREEQFRLEMEKAPEWQLWFNKHRATLIKLIITLIVIFTGFMVALFLFT